MAPTNENCRPGLKIRTCDIAESLLPKHLFNHFKVLGHCVPGHLSPLGDGAVIRLIGVNFYILPDLPLLLGEFLRRWDPSQPVQDCLPFGVQLLDEHLQLLLTLFTGMSIDAFGVLGAVRPGGRVAALEEVVIDLGDAAGSRLAGTPHDRLEICERVLCCFRRGFRHFIAQAPVDFCGGFTQHVTGDVGVDIQRGRRLAVSEQSSNCADIRAAGDEQACRRVAQAVDV